MHKSAISRGNKYTFMGSAAPLTQRDETFNKFYYLIIRIGDLISIETDTAYNKVLFENRGKLTTLKC